jgi:hypothetical protein
LWQNMYNLNFTVCNCLWHFVHSKCCANIISTSFQNIFVVTVGPLCSLSSPSWVPTPPSPSNRWYASVTVNLFTLDISHEWNHRICGLCVWLPSLLAHFQGSSTLWNVSVLHFFMTK